METSGPMTALGLMKAVSAMEADSWTAADGFQ
jgi:hypothetical protein